MPGSGTITGSGTTPAYELLTPGTGVPVQSYVAANGTWSIDPATGAAQYVANPGYRGPVDPIDYRITDSNGEHATGTLSIIMGPEAQDQTKSGNAGSPVSFDPIADLTTPGSSPSLTISLNSPDAGSPNQKTVPGEGIWTLVPGTGVITFTPEPGYVGNPTPIDYTVRDGNQLFDSAKLTVTYQAPPTAEDQDKTTKPGKPVTFDPIADLVEPGSNPDLTITLIDPKTGDPVTGTSVTVPGEGVWTIDPSTGKITFTPEDGFSGKATIGYRVTDGNELFDEAKLTVTVPAADGDNPGDGDNSDDGDDTDDGSGSDGDETLPQTGANVTAITIGAAGMLLLGAGLVVVTRRRFQS